MRNIIFILLILAAFSAKSQSTFRYIRLTPIDTVATPPTFPVPYTGGFYINVSTGRMMYKDATGYHRMGSGSGGGGGSIVGVNGTANEIDAAGTTTRTLSLSSVFKSSVGYVASPLSQFAATTSAQLAGIISNETGGGSLVFGTSPTLTTPNLGIPSFLTLTNATGLPFTGLNIFTSADFATKITNESGSGFVAMTTSPVFTTPNLGTPSAAVGTNFTGIPITGLTSSTSAQLRTLLSDEVGNGALYFGEPTGANTTFASNYTLQTTDVGLNRTGIVRITGAGPYTITYPNNSTAALPINSLISVINQATDTITVAFAGGVAHEDNGDLEIPPHGVGSFYKTATNAVDYFGSSSGGGGGISDCPAVNGEFTGAKTLAVSDVAVCNNTGFWTYTGGSDVNLTVPLFVTASFEDGSNIGISNQSAFTITVVFTGGLSGGGHTLNTIPPGESGLLYFRDENVVDLLGTRAPTEDLVATSTLDFGSTAAGAISDLTVTVTGAVVGDVVALGVPSIPNKGTYFAWVSATNTVTVRYANNDLTTAKDPSSGLFKVRILK